ncbi:hypothetical protein PC123_g8635 [Phytophthora cactorum]|nr:hypothetical protein PC123_g8635 [Phytophthora cactorum]
MELTSLFDMSVWSLSCWCSTGGRLYEAHSQEHAEIRWKLGVSRRYPWLKWWRWHLPRYLEMCQEVVHEWYLAEREALGSPRIERGRREGK